MFNDEDRILVVAAHPDDEVLAMGGLLSLAKKNKLPVSVLFLGEGFQLGLLKLNFLVPSFMKLTRLEWRGQKKLLNFLGLKISSMANICVVGLMVWKTSI